MKVFTTELSGVLLIQPDIFKDERGFFFESYSKKKYEQLGIQTEFLQDNISFSLRNVLRGLHFQSSNPQGKLVYAMQGKIFDVVVDIRKGSPTYGHWIGYELSDENNIQLWIPPGFAHGFCVPSKSALFCYKSSNYYTPESEVTIAWNDPNIDIDWPIDNPTLSPKDSDVILLNQVNENLLPTYEDKSLVTDAILYDG